MLGSVRLDLAAIQADTAQFQHVQLVGNQQDLGKQLVKLRQKTPSESGNSIMVRMAVCRDVTKRDRVMGAALQFPTGKYSGGITVEQ